MLPELRLLGGVTLLDAGGAPVAGAAAQPRRLAVLAVLADAWPATVSRDRMVGLLWSDHDEAAARRLLSQALYALRRELGDAVLAAGRDLALDPSAVRVDLVEFRRLLDAGELDAAVALHRGPALDGFHLRGAPEFERWTDALRDDARRRHVEALETLVSGATAAGDVRAAAHWGACLVDAAPYDAAAAAALVALWDRAGDRGAALAAAAAFERRVRDDLGIAPDPVVRQAADRLRATVDAPAVARRDPAADPAPSPSPSAPSPSTATSAPVAQVPIRIHAAAPRATPLHGTPRIPANAPNQRWLARAGLGTWLLVAAVGSGAAGALVAWPAVQAAAPATAASDSARVVAFPPIEVRGDPAGRAALDTALAGMLAAALDGAAGVRVARGPLSAGEAAHGPWARLHAVAVVAGDRVRLDVELAPTAAAARPTRVQVDGPRDSLIALADRAALGLLPALYPPSPTAALRPHGLRRAAALRHYLEGDLALRRGRFGTGHDLLRRATEADPTSPIAWFRRSVAAELAHRGEDADLAIAEAERRGAALPAGDRRLLRAHALWRAGDALGADSLFRAAARADGDDADAWFGLAEVAYHAGPLHGRALDLGTDAWRRLVALDSASYPAIMHLVRLEARAGDTAAVRRLLGHAVTIGASGVATTESWVIAAYATGRAADTARVGATLDGMPGYSLSFLQGVVAGLLERPALAEGIARRLLVPSRAAAERAGGHLALARLHVATGRWAAAMAELDRAAPLDPAAAAWTRAQLATLPFAAVSVDHVARARRALRGATDAPGAAPLTLQLAAEEPASATIAAYLAASLDLAAGDGRGADASLPGCGGDAAADVRALCADLRAGLRAERLRRAGDAAGALAALEAVTTVVPYQLAARSVFLARTRERWLRAELLERLGRDAEAERWYAAVPHGSWADHPYLAASHLRRGAIRERAGDRAGAAGHYRRVVALLPAPEPELAALRRDADAGLRRVAQPR